MATKARAGAPKQRKKPRRTLREAIVVLPRPDRPIAARLDEATRLASEGDFVRAEKLLRQVLKAHPKEIGAFDALGFVCFFQGRFAEARECCERSLALAPGNAYAHKGWGLCVAKQGRVDEGLASLARAMELQPAWFDPYWDFLIVCGENRRMKDAKTVLALARARFPEKRGELEELVRHFRRG